MAWQELLPPQLCPRLSAELTSSCAQTKDPTDTAEHMELARASPGMMCFQERASTKLRGQSALQEPRRGVEGTDWGRGLCREKCGAQTQTEVFTCRGEGPVAGFGSAQSVSLGSPRTVLKSWQTAEAEVGPSLGLPLPEPQRRSPAHLARLQQRRGFLQQVWIRHLLMMQFSLNSQIN